ncbi:hypothetical protein [Jeotgalibacillus salarius]|uniref:CD-NTase-associated protein 12/Pycsar effector protein TIR domain-containing protein n=1 Tax=Jeotgalibacillus salarius TaxID=546023 RepID=A0A4Y8LLF4_9BACL|nr:hypothetical protein [Jeotgalibacillus salarius]TFE03844.1 hypothetical protein E2626_00520 [Jeotgalibacillus salarius]
MGKLKKSVYSLSGKEEDLKDFKISMQNKIGHKRMLIDFERQDEEANYGKMPYFVYSGAVEFPAQLAISILSELGLGSDKLNFQKGTEIIFDNHGESYSYVKFDEIWDFIKKLNEKNFLVAMLLIASSNNHWVSITSIQQLIIRELKEYKIEIDYSKSSVFIAMSFGEEMLKARKSIANVVRDFGYEPMFIDSKEHNNQIVPEIFSEIEKAEFVISDLTEQKRGVYLEAGYALALKKQVILSCEKEDFKNNHFDVSQINTIVWSDENDLESRLRERIKAMHNLVKV